MSFTTRSIQSEDVPFLEDMLFEAAAVDVGMRSMGKEKALQLSVNRKYIEGWGRPGDAGIIAFDERGTPIGAVWYRCHPVDAPGYGFIASDVPEITIGVRSDARNQGIGGTLLEAVIALARSEAYQALSLSVDRRNPARRLYERFGFTDAGVTDDKDTSFTMILLLNEKA